MGLHPPPPLLRGKRAIFDNVVGSRWTTLISNPRRTLASRILGIKSCYDDTRHVFTSRLFSVLPSFSPPPPPPPPFLFPPQVPSMGVLSPQGRPRLKRAAKESKWRTNDPSISISGIDQGHCRRYGTGVCETSANKHSKDRRRGNEL